MLNWMKWLFISLLILLLLAVGAVFFTFNQSLPQLDGDVRAPGLQSQAVLARDELGQAIITGDSRLDAAYALGVAHGQDRFFQMDLQRRAAAGELSQWVGERALEVDKQARFHQFRQRARQILTTLPDTQRQLLQRYSQGVNFALSRMGSRPFEYWLTLSTPKPWTPEDSLLVVFSMYMDLQLGQVELDLARTGLTRYFGQSMLVFLNAPSRYQAALDGSKLSPYQGNIPSLETPFTALWHGTAPPDIGSNNWGVSGALTDSGSAMIANDMHLGLRVPIIWYRAQLNYPSDNSGEQVQVSGVTLPGLPGVVVGTNGKIAWGFTNANLDNIDWLALDDNHDTWQVIEDISLPDGSYSYHITMSEFGPVREIDGQRYALKWVAHQPYAVNLNIVNLDEATSVSEAISIARQIRIPVQNMVIADAAGTIAWTPAGAVTARSTPTATAVPAGQYDASWSENVTQLPVYQSPKYPRIWTANARVISADELQRFGDGGYALGARSQQIKQRLMEKEVFSEQDFYAIQLDNEALFLTRWHALLKDTLGQADGDYTQALSALENWQACACESSVGYTLVKHFRARLINMLLSPIFSKLEASGYKPNGLLRQVEPAIWQLLDSQPDDWLPADTKSWQALKLTAFEKSTEALLSEAGTGSTMDDLNWGKVNALRVSHPFASTVPLVGKHLNMPVVSGFGDTFMPAVQGPAFGASQRFFVRPGELEKAILTLPGGQSGHPLSPFYKTGFDDYVSGRDTPLLPGKPIYTLTLTPENG
ncbi:penicillin acylase family protein [Salinimonas sp. HHU 13199]|uniref:Penicillin acylase family protein n=1 Tax=Salinimonas profundi TaxID=2729140 RepID=A0ABR8LI53_9ALTE|nr:penicillin acylase family protein [Salinimonas profundi]MBD3584863.1 penicillin acylase family protein [Salinimonas profundi]